MEMAYKGTFGSYSVWKQGDSKHEPTHRILTDKEYSELKSQIRSLEDQLKKEKSAHVDDLTAERKKSKSDHDSIVKKAKEAIEKAEKERDEALSLNVNLKRICKENANAKRGLM